jgi:hypothetical protein
MPKWCPDGKGIAVMEELRELSPAYYEGLMAEAKSMLEKERDNGDNS